ncbi:MAG TPA: hypothetical protein VIU64_17525 [Polyangia bacterium]
MIRPHETEAKRKYNQEDQETYEAHIDEKISGHDFDEVNDLVIHNKPPTITLVDRDAVLSKYAASYPIDGEEGHAPGWVIERGNGFVHFKRPVTRI